VTFWEIISAASEFCSGKDKILIYTGYGIQWEQKLNAIAIYVGGTTLTSTIEGLSIAGSTSLETLFTPTLDLEYLINGMPLTKKQIPITPDGLPTPAVITRAIINRLGIPYFVIDSGLYYKARVPHIALPSSKPGNNIMERNALTYGTSENIFNESRKIGELLSRNQDVIIIGESIPGGTTTAAAIMEGLGFKAVEYVSSASPENPRELKRSIIRKALSRIKKEDLFYIIDEVGDPVHISLAGLAVGSCTNAREVLLAGGTQMGAVISILSKLGQLDSEKIKIATTKWILEDKWSDIFSLVHQIDRNIKIISSNVDFMDSKYKGLKMYEKGFVKEGVGAGGTMILAERLGVPVHKIKSYIYNEYERLESLGNG